jgi:hypothetical protein
MVVRTANIAKCSIWRAWQANCSFAEWSFKQHFYRLEGGSPCSTAIGGSSGRVAARRVAKRHATAILQVLDTDGAQALSLYTDSPFHRILDSTIGIDT